MHESTDSIERVETIIQRIEASGDPDLQDQVRDLLEALLELHGSGLHRLLDHVYEAFGQEFIDHVAEDHVVGSMLLLHDLHPQHATSRVVDALETVKPYLASHGGNVELVDVTQDGRVVLRLEGSCHGCPSSQATLKYTIEEAILAAAPDIRSIEIAETNGHDDHSEEFIPMTNVMWDDCPFPADGSSSEMTATRPI